ncbi:hypothetical protein RhiXN_02629 [Rhizoctonia solani]|nr:uncharacterized protein RhiXN_02629 [Rhizoctonia solani]QRW17705.1 hypothetical protein RhiXN_02629 [Rhizoctonia solani]
MGRILRSLELKTLRDYEERKSPAFQSIASWGATTQHVVLSIAARISIELATIFAVGHSTRKIKFSIQIVPGNESRTRLSSNIHEQLGFISIDLSHNLMHGDKRHISLIIELTKGANPIGTK